MAGVTFPNVRKRHPDGSEAVEDMNVEIEDGEFDAAGRARPGAENELTLDTTGVQRFDPVGGRSLAAR